MKFWTWLPLLFAVSPLIAFAQDAAVPGSIVINVVDETGEPVQGAEVHCVVWNYEALPRTEPLRPEEQGVSDAGGICAFENLTADEYYVRASHGILQSLARAYPKPNRDEPVVMTLQPAPPLRGRVSDLRGVGLEGVTITAHRQMPLAITGADGRFAIDAMPGRPTITFDNPGFEHLEWSFPEGDLVIGLKAGASANIRVVDSEGSPLTGATVNLRGHDNIQLVAEADATGRVTTLRFPIGTEVAVSAYRHNETMNWNGESKYIVTEVNQDVVLTLQGKPIIRDPAQRPPRTDVTTLSGKAIHAADGTPVAARIKWGLNPPDIANLRDRGETEDDGSFTLSDLPKRPAYVMAYPLDPRLYPVEGVVRVDLTKGPVEGLVLTVAPGAVVRGRVVNADGAPPEQNWVMLTTGGGQRWDETTEPDGTFRFGNLPPIDEPVTLTYAERSVHIDAVPAGMVVDDVAIQLPAEADKLYVTGVVVDSDENPVPGVNVTLRKGEVGQPNHEFAHAETDGLGAFRTEFQNKLRGTISTAIYHPQQFKYGDIDQRTGRECQVIEGGVLEIREDAVPAVMRIVVEVPPLEYLAGTVESSDGGPLDADLTFLYGDYRNDRLNDLQSGYFLTYRLPDEPFLLEAVADNHKPKILRAEDDFARNEHALPIVLEPGPFTEDASVWTEVTGQPDTETAIAGYIQGEQIKRKEDQYRRIAQAEDLEVPSTTPTPAPHQHAVPAEVDLVLTDPEGAPVTRIVVHNATAMGGQGIHPVSRIIAEPSQGSAAQIMTSDEGRYSVRNGSLLEAQDTARYLVEVKEGETYTPPIRLTLHRPASLTVRAIDHDGHPMTDVAVGAVDSLWQYHSYNYYGLPKTNTKGEVTFDDLPPGDYDLAVVPVRPPVGGVMPNVEPKPLFAQVEPGDNLTATVTLGEPLPGTPEAIFESWKPSNRERRNQPKPPDLDETTRNQFEQWIVQQIQDTRKVVHQNRDHVEALAAAAAAFHVKRAVEPLKSLAERLEIDPQLAGWYGGFPNGIISAIADLDGNKAVPFFESLAVNESANPMLRSYAVVGLGAIGTDDAVAAFKRLRDAAYGAPEKKEDYSHAERMAEAVIMTLYVIPGIEPRREVHPQSAQIDESYATGEITVGDSMSGATTLKMRRFGDEWLIVEIGPTMIS